MENTKKDQVVYNIQAIDALSLYKALQKNCKWVGFVSYSGIQFYPHQEDENMSEAWNKVIYLKFQIDRYAMDGNGVFVGYEEFTGKLLLHRKSEFSIPGIPWMISPYVVFPSQLDIDEYTCPEEHIYTEEEIINFLEDSDDKDWKSLTEEEIDKLSMEDLWDFANKNGLGENDYYPPDEDFIYQELEHFLNQAIDELPEYSFDPKAAEWSLEELTWKI